MSKNLLGTNDLLNLGESAENAGESVDYIWHRSGEYVLEAVVIDGAEVYNDLMDVEMDDIEREVEFRWRE